MATLEGTHGEDKEERLTARVLLKGLAKYLLFGTIAYWIVAFIFVARALAQSRQDPNLSWVALRRLGRVNPDNSLEKVLRLES